MGRFDAECLFVITSCKHERVVEGYALALTFPPDVACAHTFVEAQRGAIALASELWSVGQHRAGKSWLNRSLATRRTLCDKRFHSLRKQ